MTVTLGWWIWPAGLVGAAFILFWQGSKEGGMMGGVVHGLIAFGLLIGAVVTVIAKLWP